MAKGKGKRKDNAEAPLRSELLDEYVPAHKRIAPARQLCSASNLEVEDRPPQGKCPVCARTVEVVEIYGERRLRDVVFNTGSTAYGDSRTVSVMYRIPSHLMRHHENDRGSNRRSVSSRAYS